MIDNSLENQLETAEKNLAAQKAALAKAPERNNEGTDLAPSIAANEVRVEALKTAIKNRDAAAIEREKYLESPEHKKAVKKQEELEAEIDRLNLQYCQEGNALLERIKAIHTLDEELVKLKRMEYPHVAKLIGRGGRFLQLQQLENGLNEAKRAGEFYHGISGMFKKK